MRTRAERRHMDWAKAIRKRNMSHNTPLYDNLHQYSKNKIHCSCPLCRSKTNDKSVCGPSMNWPERDKKQLEDMAQQIAEWSSVNEDCDL